ncbi:MAG: 1-deoxy-D-xylulose-5-phosphate reductoisomerase [Lentisphaeria bacterium]
MNSFRNKKRLAILGSTGSVGRQALKVALHFAESIDVVGLCAGHQTERLAEQLQQTGAAWALSQNNDTLGRLAPDNTRILAGQDELCEILSGPNVDIVLCAIVGTAGLRPVLSAIKAGKTIALASKEILVMAGSLVMQEADKSGSKILPVDSEHCAIFQCLEKQTPKSMKRILLTASGGPFHNKPEIKLSEVTLEQALRHPTWNMGRKITLDSATLMNKGLEIIEAAWLFAADAEQIEVVIHPQSIVHSMVEFQDHSILAQLACPDMTLPIQFCLQYPERQPGLTPPLDFTTTIHLDFLPLDQQRFPAPTLAKQVLRNGGAAGAIFNAANEVAVERFCQQKIRFDQISTLVTETLQHFPKTPANSLEEILQADREARIFARQWY